MSDGIVIKQVSVLGPRPLSGQVIVALAVMLVGCTRPRPKTLIEWMAGQNAPDPGIPIRVLSWPSRPPLECYLADLPPVPEDLEDPRSAMVTEDVFMRSFVKWRQHNAMLDAYRDLRHWASTVHSCIETLKRIDDQ